MATGAIKLFLLNTSIQGHQRQSASNWTALGCFKHMVLMRSEAIQAEGEHPPQGAHVGNHLAPDTDSTWQETEHPLKIYKMICREWPLCFHNYGVSEILPPTFSSQALQ